MKKKIEQDLITVGEQIRRARLRRNLTVKEVAERAGTTAVTVLNIEKGLSSVSVGKVVSVLEVLGEYSGTDYTYRPDKRKPIFRKLGNR